MIPPHPAPAAAAADTQRLAGDFFTDQTALRLWRDHLKFIVNHVNPYTGVALKDDPTIMVRSEEGGRMSNRQRCLAASQSTAEAPPAARPHAAPPPFPPPPPAVLAAGQRAAGEGLVELRIYAHLHRLDRQLEHLHQGPRAEAAGAVHPDGRGGGEMRGPLLADERRG